MGKESLAATSYIAEGAGPPGFYFFFSAVAFLPKQRTVVNKLLVL